MLLNPKFNNASKDLNLGKGVVVIATTKSFFFFFGIVVVDGLHLVLHRRCAFLNIILDKDTIISLNSRLSE